MGVLKDEQQPLCPCYKECQEFHKLLELKDSGLVVYCHRSTGDITQSGAVGCAANTSRDVFILHNKKEGKMETSELLSELEKKDISCPRCRKMFEHAQELMKEVTSIDGKIVMGICDHCRNKAQGSKKPYCTCDKIVNKFISVKGEQKDDIKKHVKTWLSKMGYLLKDGITFIKSKQIKTRAYSDLQINQDFKSLASGHEPEYQQMFYPKTHKSDINLNTEMKATDFKEVQIKQSVTFFRPTESRETSFAHSPHERVKIMAKIPSTFSADSDTTFAERYAGFKELPTTSLIDRTQEEIYDDKPSMDAKETLKRRHDLSLRQMMRPEDDDGMIYSVSKRPDVYEIPKIVSWEQKEKTSEHYLEPEMNKKAPTPGKTKSDVDPGGKRDLDYKSNRLVKDGLSGTSLKRSEDRFSSDGKLKPQRSVDKTSLKTKKLDPLVDKSKVWRNVLDSKASAVTVSKPQFSFFFPKTKKQQKKQPKPEMTSSHLIKNTRDKFRQQDETRKKEKEKERLEMLEQKKLAQEKKQQAEEMKKQQAEEIKKKQAEDQKKYEQEKLIEQKKHSKAEKSTPVGKEEKDAKSETEQKVKNDEILQKDIKDSKSKPGKSDENGKPKLKEKGNDDLISKLHQKQRQPTDQGDKATGKSEKVPKEKVESKDKDEVQEKKKDKTITPKQAKDEKAIRDEQLLKEREEKELKEKAKQIEQLRKEKEALKKQAAEKKAEQLKQKDVPANKKREASSEVAVSMSKIQKSMTDKKETSKNEDIFVKKQEGFKEKEGEKKETSGKITKDELQKLQAKHLKEKEEALKKKKQLEYEAQLAKAKQEADRKALKSGSIKVTDSEDDLMLKLVRIKQAATIQPSDVGAEIIREHKCHHGSQYPYNCPLCLNSELEMDVLSLHLKKNPPKEVLTDIIMGEDIFTIKRRLKKTKEPEVIPKLFQKIFLHLPHKEIVEEPEPVKEQINTLPKMDAKGVVEVESTKGILRYALSDRTFIEKGWTMLPTEKVVRKELTTHHTKHLGIHCLYICQTACEESRRQQMNVYRMRPAHPEFDWFEHNKNKRLMTYDSGERLAEIDDNGRGRWFYKSGQLALDYYNAEETNAQQRFVIYSSGEPDERGRSHPITILATFDYLGNGIVFDHAGKIRLKYNQTEGVVLDRGIGPVSHWKWHTLNDPPVLQQVMIDTQMAHKDPNILKLGTHPERTTRPDNEEMLAIEFDNFIKEKSKKLSQKFKPFQIKMKALKINEYFSLRVLDQATVYLIYRDGSTNLKLNIGMILDHQEIVDTDTAEVGEVSNSLERFPARTDSLAGLQRSVAHAQRYERQQTERDRRLRPPEPCASADQLTAAVSPPLRLPLRTVPTGSSSSTGYCCRKPTNNLYYNTRLL